MEIATGSQLHRLCLDELRPPRIGWPFVSRRRRALVRRIEQALADLESKPAYPDVADAVRLRFSGDDTVQIPVDPIMRVDRDGVWINAWVRPSTAGPVDWAALLAKLPTVAREVFLLHRVDGLSYEAIGRRLGIQMASVETHLASALAILDAEAMKGGQ